MVVVINAFSAKVGGGRTYLYNLLENLPQEHVKVYVFGYDDLDQFQSESVRRVRTRFPVYNPVLRLFWECFILPVWLARLKADILFCPGGIVNTRAPKGCRVVTMFRNMLPFDEQALADAKSIRLKFKNYLLRKRMLASMASADLVIFISDYARRVIERYISVNRAVTIVHGIGNDFFVGNKALARPALPFSGKYILYVSRFEFYKRHLQLVEAYTLLSESIRDEYKLLIVGGGGGQAAAEVQSFILGRELDASVFLLGEYSYAALPALYKHASLFTFMSACENCPNILLEAMGSGVPIVSSDYAPMPEFGGAAIRYVSPDDPQRISEVLAETLSDPVLLQALSARVIERSLDYKWSRTAMLTWHALFKIANT
ncbi:glycosyltransferase family 4 protein [Pseudomonas kuykendallii]|uniref:Glycosyltransferase involved in cell wall bisynthesis n=1 Tax=Pseudomonas kuykendallii TaxID=1007099 RepID=A0A1H3GCI0_9PSED|nr:glycosyltransferase family 1 protein [Pseudomonas kuykendallii]MCQ4271896.1 glycosyltransferase family 4 protein [Pseudomonas kuykendallii]SDY01052.1 Glycosyltransferase involved in cell wall bisynthesis [Pseudomonas kuykendallii]